MHRRGLRRGSAPWCRRCKIRDSRGMAFGGLFVTDLERVGGVEIFHAASFDKGLRHPVIRGGQEEAMVEPDVERAGREFAVPVRRRVAKAEVPFANDRGGIARALKDPRQGLGARLNDSRAVRRRDACAFLPEGIRACEQRKARGCAGGRGGITAGKPDPVARELVNGRRLHRLGTVGRHVPITEVVGHDDDNVRPLRRIGRPEGKQREGNEQVFHGASECWREPGVL